MSPPYMPRQTILNTDGTIEHHNLAAIPPLRWLERRLNLRLARSYADITDHKPCVCRRYAMTDDATCPFCDDHGYL